MRALGLQRFAPCPVLTPGERHGIRNTGRTSLKTLNLYYPPAYDDDEETLPPGRQ